MTRGERRPSLQVMRVPVFLGAKSPYRSKVARGPGEVTWPHPGLLSYGCYACRNLGKVPWPPPHSFKSNLGPKATGGSSVQNRACLSCHLGLLTPRAQDTALAGSVRRHLCVVGDKGI